MTGNSEDLAHAIVEWARDRPLWTQRALGMLAKGEPLGDEDFRALADLAEQEAAGEHPEVPALKDADLVGRADGNEAVLILGVSDPKAVNALSWTGGVQFTPGGITVVYGENGSGKSGYARILKKVTRARHSSEVLTNVFQAPMEQSARLTVSLGSKEIDLDWPSDRPDFLSRVSFYDRDCATQYISTDTEVAYRPGALTLLDDMVGVAGRVRSALEERQSLESREVTPLPAVPAGSRAAEFLAALSANTTFVEIDIAGEIPETTKDLMTDFDQRIANLEAHDYERQRRGLEQVIADVQLVTDHIADTRDALSERAIAAIGEARGASTSAREAADVASAAQFASEPIKGIGSSAWAVLWEAARGFSEEVAFPRHSFPVVESEGTAAPCVLCHQTLSAPAATRLRAFEEYVANDSERLARRAQEEFEELATAATQHEVLHTAVELSLQRIQASSELAHAELRSELERLVTRQSQVTLLLDDGVSEVDELPPLPDLAHAISLAEQAKRQVSDLEHADREEQLAILRRERAELQGRLDIREHRTAIRKRIGELKKAKILDQAIRTTDTRGVTRKAAELLRTHVSEVLIHRFGRETALLGVERVRLADAGGRQGNLKHRPQLENAIQRAPIAAVLSEGQQTALGLAGFLTEVEGDATQSAVVFDDPVTSLDHVVQERVASRIVRLAKDRQVIIFTHEIAFVVDVKRAALAASVPVAELWVDQSGPYVGRVSKGGPWDTKVVGERVGELEHRLAEVRRVLDEGDPQRCQEEIRSWYQDLRTVWERALEEVVLAPVQARGKLELRPSNLKVLARFTDSDNREFQEAFTRCGDRGSHDRSPQLNRPRPPITELEEDIAVLRSWHKRVRQYAS